MSLTPLRTTKGRAFAGLALLLCASGCEDSEPAAGPGAPSQGEEAALHDAEAMLETREPVENAPEAGEPQDQSP